MPLPPVLSFGSRQARQILVLPGAFLASLVCVVPFSDALSLGDVAF